MKNLLRNASESEQSGRLRRLIGKCSSCLEEMHEITLSIADSVNSDKLDSIESLYTKRGAKIKLLTESEQDLKSMLTAVRPDETEPVLRDYVEKRDTLFKEILSSDQNMNRSIRSKRETILNEIKNLNRGKRMRKEYINRSTLGTAFIDIKE